MIISISGTPGTGKTTVSRLVARQYGARLIILTRYIRAHRIYDGYDKGRKAMIVDSDHLRKHMASDLKGSKKDVIIDGHLSHFLKADIIFVLRLDPAVLEKRLRKRGFSKKKTIENVQAEVLDVIYGESLKKGREVIQIDATGKSPAYLAKRILNTLRSKKYKSDKVDWSRKYCCYLDIK